MESLRFIVAVLAVSSAAHARTIFVDDDCFGPGTGSAVNPFCSIQSAIDSALETDEIVVGTGTYFEAIDFGGKAVTVRSTNPAAPAVVANTVINGTGNPHVVRCVSGEGANTVLSGFVITGGGSGGNVGGGMYNAEGSSPTVTNCTFSGNSAVNGAGMYNINGSNPTVTGCTFEGNTANQSGGGMFNYNSSPTVTDCTFSGNTASNAGGGMYTIISEPQLVNCTFSGNAAGNVGGGMYNESSSPSVTSCVFIGNDAVAGGGGMRNSASSPVVTNCLFTGNTTNNSGAAMYNADSNPVLSNCTFVGNTADWAGGAMHSVGSDSTMINCVLWGDSPEEISSPLDTPTVIFSNVQGGWPGLGNIDADPMFVDPGAGDFRLGPNSPCADAGSNWGVAIDLADLDDDNDTVELSSLDLDGNPRFADEPATADAGCGLPVVVDMGAYESQGDPAPEPFYFADLNHDGFVSVADLRILNGCLASNDPDCCFADLDLDGEVGMSDRRLILARLIRSAALQ